MVAIAGKELPLQLFVRIIASKELFSGVVALLNQLIALLLNIWLRCVLRSIRTKLTTDGEDLFGKSRPHEKQEQFGLV